MSKTKNNITWLGYIETMSSKDYDAGKLNLNGLEAMLKKHQQLNAIFHHSVPMIYLVDYTTGKYLLASKTTKRIIGFDHEEFMQGGLDLVINNYRQDDLKLYNEKIFPDRLKILQQIPVEEHSKYVFSYNYQFKNKNGDYNTLLQRNSFIKSDEQGKPLLSFGVVLNITHFRPYAPVIQTVEKTGGENNYAISPVPFSKKIYSLQDEDELFSPREKEILLWMTEGLTSSEIAKKLFISEHTVINHRKNMLLKSGAANVAALITYALRNHII